MQANLISTRLGHILLVFLAASLADVLFHSRVVSLEEPLIENPAAVLLLVLRKVEAFGAVARNLAGGRGLAVCGEADAEQVLGDPDGAQERERRL
jgi:hypothetical protein